MTKIQSLIRLPYTFVYDHNDRCDIGKPYVDIVKTAGNCAYAQVTDVGLLDLYNDALYYQHENTSAKRTVKAIERQMGDDWMHDYKNNNYMFQ